MNRVPALLLTICATATAFGTLVGCAPAESQIPSDTLDWTAPTTRTDGSALPPAEIAQYRAEVGRTLAGPFDLDSLTIPGNVTNYVVADRPLDGRRCYRLFTIDTTAQESAPSNAACTEKCPAGEITTEAGFCALKAPPSPASDLTAD